MNILFNKFQLNIATIIFFLVKTHLFLLSGACYDLILYQKINQQVYFIDPDFIPEVTRSPTPPRQRSDVKFFLNAETEVPVAFGCYFGCAIGNNIDTMNDHYRHNASFECTYFARPEKCVVNGCTEKHRTDESFLKHAVKKHSGHEMVALLIWILAIINHRIRN